jgi:hypothetical protein
VIDDLVNLRRLMRESIDPNAPEPTLYEIAEIRG